MISVALAAAYSIMRSQGTALLLQSNAGLRSSARQAAMTGMALARRKMHTLQWAGVDTTLTGVLGGNNSYRVSFATGDPSLVPGHPDYEDYSFRVTVDVTGSSQDPVNPSRIARHRIRAVFRLIPRALADEPAGWDTLSGYTLCQLGPDQFEVDVPCRIEGPVRIQAGLRFAEDLDWPSECRERYLTDLNNMRFSGAADWRPFTGPLELPFADQPGGLISLLSSSMAITTSDAPPDSFSLSPVGYLGDYQLYPGGKVYSVQSVGATLANQTIEPDPATNPLGIFVHEGKVDVYDNVSFKGTLIVLGNSDGDLQLRGTFIQFTSVDLPPVEGSDEPVRLPLVILEDDFCIQTDSQGKLDGLLVAAHEFEVCRDDPGDIYVPIQGRAIAGKILIRRREGWRQSKGWWEDQYQAFLAQENDGIPYFPLWLAVASGLDPKPEVGISPEPDPVRYHWRNANNPVYVPHPDDEGLRWDLLEWSENP
jgi:hypothetical protein